MLYSLNYLSNKLAHYQNKYNKNNSYILNLIDKKIKNILKKYTLKLKILNEIYELPINIKEVSYFRPLFKMKTHCRLPEVKADDSNAVDFDIPENTHVYSITDGVIIALKNDSDIGGNDEKFVGMDNYVYIQNTNTKLIFCYRHLKKSSQLYLNKFIKKGECIGVTGNTGYIITPHLHFAVYSYNPDSKYLLKSIKIEIKKYKSLN